jgi:anthranilate/para-aminobenzoate synthase component I
VSAAPDPSLLTLPTVHHLVTEVRGTLRDGVGLYEVTAAMFPGGSITGAPKRRTVEIIAQLEDHERGIYCGAIVALDPTGFRMSIPIRTGVIDDDGLTVCAGGGIVIDSDPEAERAETQTKTLAFCRP